MEEQSRYEAIDPGEIEDIEQALQCDALKDIPELREKKNILGSIAAFFIKQYRVTFLLVAIVMFWGIKEYSTMQREAQPKVTIPMAIVVTRYTGASPEEVETLVTDKVEEKLKDLEDVSNMTSSSSFGSSAVYIDFEQGADIDEKIKDMREKLANIDQELPEDADAPQVSDVKTSNGHILVFSLSGEQNIVTLQNIAKKLKEEIEQADGVKQVDLLGDVDREIAVILDSHKLAQYKVALAEVRNALISANVNFPGGDLELKDKIYSVRTVGRFEDVEKIGNTVIRTSPSGQILLKDIASIEDSFEKQDIFVKKSYLDASVKGSKPAVIVAVKKKENYDLFKATDNIIAEVDKFKAEYIPDTVRLEIVSNQRDYVSDILGGVTNNAFSGLVLVIVVLFLFIGLGESLVVSTVIPLSIFAAFGVMKAIGLTINNITLFSMILAVGMLVDNGIVIMENIDRLRFRGLSAKLASEAGTNQVAPAVAAATLTTVAAFYPLMLTSGIMGDFIKPIPLTVISALVCSLFMAVTVTPSLSSQFLKRHRSSEGGKDNAGRKKAANIAAVVSVVIMSMVAFMDQDKTGLAKIGILSIAAAVVFGTLMYMKVFKSKENHKGGFLHIKYSSFLSWVLDKRIRKLAVLGVTFAAFLLSLSMPLTGILKVEMFGQSDYRWLYINIETPPGSPVEETGIAAEQVEKILLDIPEIDHFVSYVGHTGVDIWQFYSGDSKGTPNTGKIYIELADKKDRQRSSINIAAQLRDEIKKIPAARIEVTELEDGPPTGAPVYIIIKGRNYEDINKVAYDFEGILKQTSGIRDVNTSIKKGKPVLEVRIDKQKAAQLGIDDMSAALSVRNAVQGLEATTFRHNQDEINVVLKMPEQKLESIYDLENIFFYSRSGQAVPFSQIASITEADSIKSLSHEDGKRAVYVSADIKPGENPKISTSAEAVSYFKNSIENYVLPAGTTIEYGGENEAMGDSFGDMMSNMAIAGILVFIILSIQFNSLSQPFIILMTVPMAVIGVMPSLFVTGNSFGFVAFIGLVALIGIAVNDAIVLIDYINYLRSKGHNMKEAIIETGITRMNPVFATTITTVGGILPISMSDPMLAPMGITLMAGLCTATVLTLVIIPIMYSIFEGQKRKLRGKISKSASPAGAVKNY